MGKVGKPELIRGEKVGKMGKMRRMGKMGK
jgi:hypothetical protein